MSRVSQARNLGKYFLLIDNMLVVLGFFVVFPLISIRFVDQMGWAAVMVGIALGLRQFIQQGLGIFGGAIADRFGAKPMIVTGMLMRAAGFATMGIAHEPWLLWFSCFLSGLGGTLFDPPRSALVVKLIRPEQRGRFFSLLMMQDSAGAVIGALLGSWLLQYDFRLVCATGAILFILCALFNAWLLPAWKLSTVRTPVREGMRRVMSDKRFVTYVLTLAGYYMLAVQVMLMLPIMVNDIAGSPAAVKWMYAIEACLSLTLLYPIARWSEKRFRLEHRLMAGLLVMSLSMLPIGMVGNLQQLFTLICAFYIGSVIAEPARETLSASLADARARGSYMGFSRLGLAIGGAIGYIGGGWLFDMGKALAQPELPWMMLGIIGFITFLALGWQFSHKRTPRRMIGQKMVPILQKDDSRYLPESMDIVHYVDNLDGKPLLTGKRNPAIEEWLRKVNGYVNQLLLPRFAKSAFDEFSTPAARQYFIRKKEASSGSFDNHLAHSAGLIKKIGDDLRLLDKLIVQPNAVNGELSEDDIHLFPLLRNLTLVAGIHWPTKVADYRDNMAKQTQINLLSSMAI
ncbi:multidrug efflux MFS transporter MdtH [Salmonella enterica]|nr:multidrug efflux MFS transporter MdtH [Salmonella enterica]